MNAIIQGFDWLISSITEFWEFLTSMLRGLVLAFTYFFKICTLALNVLSNLPDWLMAFGTITIAIVSVYFVIGREAGKN